MIHTDSDTGSQRAGERQHHSERGVAIEREADDAEHREERRDALDGERLEAAVAVDVNRVDAAVMIEPGDGENESEDQNDSADDSGQQEHLFDAVVRSKPLSHGRNSPPDVLFGCPGSGDYSGEFKKPDAKR